MLWKTIWIVFQFALLTAITCGLFVWQGGWWHIQPVSLWSKSSWLDDHWHQYRGWHYAQFTPDGRSLLLVNWELDGTDAFCVGFELLDLQSGSTVLQHSVHRTRDNEHVYCHHASGLVALLDTLKKNVILFDLVKREQFGEFPFPAEIKSIRTAAFSRDGSHIVFDDCPEQYWCMNVATGKFTATANLQKYIERPYPVTVRNIIARNEIAAVVNTNNQTINAWSLVTGKVIWQKSFPGALISQVESLPGNGCFAVTLLEQSQSGDQTDATPQLSSCLIDEYTGAERARLHWPTFADSSRLKKAYAIHGKVGTTSDAQAEFSESNAEITFLPESDRAPKFVGYFPKNDWTAARPLLRETPEPTTASTWDILGGTALQSMTPENKPEAPPLPYWLNQLPESVQKLLRPILDRMRNNKQTLFTSYDVSGSNTSTRTFEFPGFHAHSVAASSDSRWLACFEYDNNARTAQIAIFALPLHIPLLQRLAIALSPLLLFAFLRYRSRRTAPTLDEIAPTENSPPVK